MYFKYIRMFYGNLCFVLGALEKCLKGVIYFCGKNNKKICT